VPTPGPREAAPVTIEANVTPGPQSAVSTTGDVTINGSTTPAAESQPLPAVEVPDMTLERGVTVDGTRPYTILPGRAGLQSLVVQANGVATVQGPACLVLNSLTVNPGGTLEFDTAQGPVSVYVMGSLAFEEGSFVSTDALDAGQVSIQCSTASDTPLVLGSQSEFHGIVYAPEAPLVVFPNFEVYGSLVGKRLLLKGATQLHYDVVLDAIAGELGLPRLVSWRIVDLSNPGTVADLDPFMALGLDRSLLAAPADAHEDQLLKIAYTNTLGGTDTYSGLESGFDWSLVDTVEAISRDGVTLDPSAALAREKARLLDVKIIDL